MSGLINENFALEMIKMTHSDKPSKLFCLTFQYFLQKPNDFRTNSCQKRHIQNQPLSKSGENANSENILNRGRETTLLS